MTDLNTLTTSSPLYLVFGCAIDSHGVITGLGMTGTGEYHTYLATPIYVYGRDGASDSK